MPDNTRRILCACDLSENCESLYKCALGYARERRANLLLVHIITMTSIKAARMRAYFLNECIRKNILRQTKKPVFQVAMANGSLNLVNRNTSGPDRKN